MNDFREKKNARLMMAINGMKNEGGRDWEDKLVDALIHHAEFYVPMRTMG
ncbi:MAG: enhanced serine sensitivity protein SseB, partial [Oribacterium parvum]|nr:enhanced serine sensitivity protein SseB [Oribacterium parvum]